MPAMKKKIAAKGTRDQRAEECIQAQKGRTKKKRHVLTSPVPKYPQANHIPHCFRLEDVASRQCLISLKRMLFHSCKIWSKCSEWGNQETPTEG